ncbi:MAG: HNH endonuclease [Proteobacteria bacterium]|nr:HNH endonuclease [Pseudomonadota bacterium]
MPYVNKARPYKKEYKQQKARGELPDRMERQRARRAMDKKGISRKGKDVAHVKALSKGGSNKDGVRLESPHKNRSFPRKSSGAMK